MTIGFGSVCLLFFLSVADASEKSWNRETLLKAGIAGQLKKPEEWAQFHLLACQPRSAWKATQKIVDPKIRLLFEAVILSYASVERPPFADLSKGSEKSRIEGVEFPLDVSEIWQDEIEDMQVKSTCRFFPLAEVSMRPILAEQAKERLAKVVLGEAVLGEAVPARFQILALATDVGLRPPLTEVDLLNFRGAHSTSPYFNRFQLMLAPAVVSRETTIKIRGLKASVSTLRLVEADLTPHALEIPWLLQ